MKTRTLKRWTPEALALVAEYFALTNPTKKQKKDLQKELGRTWGAIYNKNWELRNPIKAKACKDRAKSKEKSRRNGTSPKTDVIQVTHVTKLPTNVTTIKIGECIIETYSSKIKINDVLIEV